MVKESRFNSERTGFSGRVVAISDFCTKTTPDPIQSFDQDWPVSEFVAPYPTPDVLGGYLQRLPLALMAAGFASSAEVWTFAGRDGECDSDNARWDGTVDPEAPGITRRVFRADPHSVPYGSFDALRHLAVTAPPKVLCVWGLGVDLAIMKACESSMKIYNSIDANPLRIPLEIAERFDLFITGSEWQSAEIKARLPKAKTVVLPIGPEFASDLSFYPTGGQKDRDVVYVACAQSYKRHDILFEALAANQGTTALLVIGYGDLVDEFRRKIDRLGIDVEIVGPPGVCYSEVNKLINRAKVGVVCGRDDGAPAILTEYQLANLPVLANAELSCGLQYVLPESGLIAAPGADFSAALKYLVDQYAQYSPRQKAIESWGWRESVSRLITEMDA